jgi:hypothetical protein
MEGLKLEGLVVEMPGVMVVGEMVEVLRELLVMVVVELEGKQLVVGIEEVGLQG